MNGSNNGFGPVHMVLLGAPFHQARKNISPFHKRDVILPSQMKSPGSELAPNQNTAFHLGNQVDMFIWRTFIPFTYDLASDRQDLGKQASSLTQMNAM